VDAEADPDTNPMTDTDPNPKSDPNPNLGKSSESVQCAMLKACDTCADIGQL